MIDIPSIVDVSEFTGCVEDLFNKSQELLEHLKTYSGQMPNRESFIEKIQRFLNERDLIIERLQSYEPELKVLIEAHVSKVDRRHFIDIEKEIADGLQIVLNDIQKSRMLLREKKRSRQQYRNPFASVERDGMFVDKRK